MTNTVQMINTLMTTYGLTEDQAIASVVALEAGDEVSHDVYEILFEYYCDHDQIPYGVATAKDGDPIDWVNVRIADELGMGF